MLLPREMIEWSWQKELLLSSTRCLLTGRSVRFILRLPTGTRTRGRDRTHLTAQRREAKNVAAVDRIICSQILELFTFKATLGGTPERWVGQGAYGFSRAPKWVPELRILSVVFIC